MSDNNSSNRALPLFITLFLASLALNLFLFFKYAKNGTEIQKKNQELELLYTNANYRADSLQKELDFAIQQLQDKINENLAQEDLKEDLRKQLEAQKIALQVEKRKIAKLIAGGGSGGPDGPKTLAEAKNEINKLKKENTEYIAMVEEAQSSYLKAKEEAKINAETANAFRQENESLLEMAETMSTKLSEASIVRIAGLSVNPINEKKGKQEPEDKASKVDRLKINFSVLASSITEPEEKELVIRIISPSGVVLTKDNNKLQDKSELASLKETITYDGTEKGITYYYDQEAEYSKGSYKIEILNNDKLLDRKSFSLR
jgi:hypothetical protein